ncbi:MAG: hypothetical protein B7W98_02470, partial [Parcubacteria group bacterium 20-58-5]
MKLKAYITTAVLSLAIGFGVGFGLNLNQPAAPVVAMLPTSAAVNSVLQEAMWAAGGPAYRSEVSSLSDVYKEKMDGNCNAPGFNTQPAVAAYGGFVPSGAESVFAAAVGKQIATMACIAANGSRKAA